jgi:IS1 family transposase
MNKTSTETRVLITKALIDGVGVNATSRLSGAAKNTILKLLAQLGEACAAYHEKHVRNVKASRVQCDEIWSFCYSKQKNVPDQFKGVFGYGDCWTWTALDQDSKLIVSYMLGLRDGAAAQEFMDDVAGRLANRVQLTTDGLKCYLEAVMNAFDGDIDFAQLVKIYGPEQSGAGRYSPPQIIGTKKEAICGQPEERSVSTSHVERQNLSMRMGMRRFTRLTNAHSKKVENHAHAIALYFMHYNYCKIHSTLRVTPAMEAGLTDHVWEIEELLALLD